MPLVVVVLVSAALLLAAYWTYGPVLERLLRIRNDAKTPAVEMADDVDYMPIEPKFLLGQHFSAIAAAGPIVGPILAGAMFGWFPAILWILVGSIFIGGVHDFSALVASIRHKARSIAEIVRDHVSPRAYILFLAFVWLSLVYIIVAFTDITAAAFLGEVKLESGRSVLGAGIATSSLLYLALPIAMGLLLRYTSLGIGLATLIFLPLVGVSIWIGQSFPFDLATLLNLSPADAQRTWSVLLLAYCFVASVIPVWLLLQPRGHLGGYFLYIALAGGMLGLVLGGQEIRYPAFTNWVANGQPLFPMLFILIACGACSGFHALIASGTTSKQLKREGDARVIGYGAMLLEGMVAIVSLCCVMTLTADDALVQNPKPNYIYALGIGNFLAVVGIPAAFGVSFGLMAFTTFVYDTLDVCTRLGRYILQELTGLRGPAGRWFSTALTAGVPLWLLLRQNLDEEGKIIPTWRVFWEVFGASNQLLASLTLMGITVWLWRTRGQTWIWFVLGLPTAWMYVMSMWALGRILTTSLIPGEEGLRWPSPADNPVPTVSVVLLVLGTLLLVEAALALIRRPNLPPPSPSLVPTSA